LGGDPVTVILCGGGGIYTRRVLHCITCKRRRRVVSLERSLWYAPILTCLGCGDSWSDGELLERPFARGWRAKAMAKAKADWAAAVTPAEHKAWFDAEIKAFARIADELKAVTS
jgi:hypothetical protein